MTSYFYTGSLLVPAGTPVAAPVSAPVGLVDENLDAVRIIIPPGHAALTGLVITWGGTQVVPYGAGTWITGDDEQIDYPWDGEVTAAGLVVAGYNLDIFPHTFYLRWTLTDLPGASPVVIASPQAAAPADPAQLAAISTLAGSPDLTDLSATGDLPEQPADSLAAPVLS